MNCHVEGVPSVRVYRAGVCSREPLIPFIQEFQVHASVARPVVKNESPF